MILLSCEILTLSGVIRKIGNFEARVKISGNPYQKIGKVIIGGKRPATGDILVHLDTCPRWKCTGRNGVPGVVGAVYIVDRAYVVQRIAMAFTVAFVEIVRNVVSGRRIEYSTRLVGGVQF